MDAAGRELAAASAVLAAHGLFDGARWAAEQATSLGVMLPDHAPDPRTLHALALLATHNYALAAEAAAEAGAAGCAEAAFIEAYATWLDGEGRRARMEAEEAGTAPVNPNARRVLGMLEARGAAGGLSGPEAYLLGVVHSALGQRSEARAALRHAVARAPCLLAAWEELAKAADADAADAGGAEAHWMAELHSALAALRLRPDAALPRLVRLAERFARSPYFAAAVAAAQCARRDLDGAARAFEALLSAHPRRLQDLHHYSDVLYVKEDRARLAWLARHALGIDAFRAETQCVLGNLHALHGRHDAAIACFQRALRLRPDWAAAWVLRGHEHVELKQTGAAVQAYRRALGARPDEYRAWYGLGQAYELLKMPSRSLHYYRRAALLRPHDSRMWCAVGSCLETLGRRADAVRAFTRAHECEHSRDPLPLARLAALHAELGAGERAAHYHKRHLDRRDEDGDDSQPTLEALLYLAGHCKGAGRYADAAAYCSRLLDYPGREKEEAKALLRELHSLQSEDDGQVQDM